MGVSAARRVTSAFKACPTRIRRLRGGSRPPRTRKQMLSTEIDEAVVQAHHLQVNKAEFLRLAEERFDVFQEKRVRTIDKQGVL